jgi:hypothetical protein
MTSCLIDHLLAASRRDGRKRHKTHVANLAKLAKLTNLIPTGSVMLALRIPRNLSRRVVFYLILPFRLDVIPP